MILTKETLSAGPKIGTGEGVAHSKRWYVALVRIETQIDQSGVSFGSSGTKSFSAIHGI